MAAATGQLAAPVAQTAMATEGAGPEMAVVQAVTLVAVIKLAAVLVGIPVTVLIVEAIFQTMAAAVVLDLSIPVLTATRQEAE